MIWTNLKAESKMDFSSNVASGKAAADLLGLLEDCLASHPEAKRERVLERLAALAAAEIGMVVKPDAPDPREPFCYNAALDFELTVVPFGKYEGLTVADVPPSYWASFTESEFNKRLRRYLLSTRYLERQ